MPATRGKRPGTTGNDGTDDTTVPARVFGDPAPKALTALGRLIVALCDAKSLSLAALADQAELDPKTLHNLLRGKHGPKKMTLLSIAKVLDAPIEWLTNPESAPGTSAAQKPAPSQEEVVPDTAELSAVPNQQVVPTHTSSSRSIAAAIITVLPEYELAAALRRFGIEPLAREHERRGSLRLWYAHIDNARHGRLDVAITSIGPSGNADASSVTTSIIEYLHPQLTVLVGIAAGRKEFVQLGDVVVAEQVIAYEFEKRTPDGPLPRPRHKTLHHSVRDDLAFFRPSAKALNADIQSECARLSEDDLPPADMTPQTVAIRYPATIASGEAVLADGSLDTLAKRFGDDRLIAGEMESAGFCTAAERSSTPWLTIRGISDFGNPQSKDGRAKDRFHHFASVAAASYAYQFLRDAYSADLRRTVGAEPAITEREPAGGSRAQHPGAAPAPRRSTSSQPRVEIMPRIGAAGYDPEHRFIGYPTLSDQCHETGLVGVFLRNGSRRPRVRELFNAAESEIVMLSVSGFTTFHDNDREVEDALQRGCSVYFSAINPTSRLYAGLDWNLRATLLTKFIKMCEYIRNKWTHRGPRFHFGIMNSLLPYSFVMTDGDIEPQGTPNDNFGHVRIIPVRLDTYHDGFHDGILFHFDRRGHGEVGGFDYFAEDARRRWRDEVVKDHQTIWKYVDDARRQLAAGPPTRTPGEDDEHQR